MADNLQHWRNGVACTLCNWIMRHVATPAYRARIDTFVRCGMGFLYGPDALKGHVDAGLFAERAAELSSELSLDEPDETPNLDRAFSRPRRFGQA